MKVALKRHLRLAFADFYSTDAVLARMLRLYMLCTYTIRAAESAAPNICMVIFPEDRRIRIRVSFSRPSGFLPFEIPDLQLCSFA